MSGVDDLSKLVGLVPALVYGGVAIGACVLLWPLLREGLSRVVGTHDYMCGLTEWVTGVKDPACRWDAGATPPLKTLTPAVIVDLKPSDSERLPEPFSTRYVNMKKPDLVAARSQVLWDATSAAVQGVVPLTAVVAAVSQFGLDFLRAASDSELGRIVGQLLTATVDAGSVVAPKTTTPVITRPTNATITPNTTNTTDAEFETVDTKFHSSGIRKKRDNAGLMVDREPKSGAACHCDYTFRERDAGDSLVFPVTLFAHMKSGPNVDVASGGQVSDNSCSDFCEFAADSDRTYADLATPTGKLHNELAVQTTPQWYIAALKKAGDERAAYIASILKETKKAGTWGTDGACRSVGGMPYTSNQKKNEKVCASGEVDGGFISVNGFIRNHCCFTRANARKAGIGE